MDYGSYTGPDGQSGTSTTQHYGGMSFQQNHYSDGQGNTTTQNCTTNRFGSQSYTSCY